MIFTRILSVATLAAFAGLGFALGVRLANHVNEAFDLPLLVIAFLVSMLLAMLAASVAGRAKEDRKRRDLEVARTAVAEREQKMTAGARRA